MIRFNRKNIVIGALVFVILVTLTLTGVINNKNKEIDDFKIYLNEYQVRVENYILDENEEEYNELIKKSEQAIDNKDIDELKCNLEELENKIIENNTNNLKKKVDDIKAIKVEKEEKKEEISTKLKEVEILIEEKNFKKANEELDVLNKNIKDILAAIEQEYIEGKLIEIEKFISNGKLQEAKLEIDNLLKKNLNNEQQGKVDQYVKEISQKDISNKNIDGDYSKSLKSDSGDSIGVMSINIKKLDDGRYDVLCTYDIYYQYSSNGQEHLVNMEAYNESKGDILTHCRANQVFAYMTLDENGNLNGKGEIDGENIVISIKNNGVVLEKGIEEMKGFFLDKDKS